MAAFSPTSAERLATCHPDLQRLFRAVVRDYDCTVLEGHRGQDRQDALHAEGKSRVKWPRGRHNRIPSLAADVIPYPIDWEDARRCCHFAGYVQAVADRMGIAIRWGGDWDGDRHMTDQAFDDLVHFELIGPKYAE